MWRSNSVLTRIVPPTFVVAISHDPLESRQVHSELSFEWKFFVVSRVFPFMSYSNFQARPHSDYLH